VQPIPFIVGVGRSGTTLLRMMLDAHPELAIPPETGFIPALDAAAPSNPDEFLRVLEATPTWPDMQLSARVLRPALGSMPHFDVASALAAVYRAYASNFGKPRWGDKTPMHCLHMETIQRLFPSVCFLHVIRDGRDVLQSVRGLSFAPGADVATIAADWRDRILAARRQSERLERYVEVRYEELVREPQRVLRSLCERLELAFDPVMLRYYERAPARLAEHLTRYAPDGSVVVSHEQRVQNQRMTMRPPAVERIGAWRTTLAASEHAAFSAVAGELLRALGYL